jgi:hypothetical protein
MTSSAWEANVLSYLDKYGLPEMYVLTLSHSWPQTQPDLIPSISMPNYSSNTTAPRAGSTSIKWDFMASHSIRNLSASCPPSLVSD